jgi:hypothetical protein
MAKLLTNREMELFRLAMKLNETGGVYRRELADSIASKLSFEIDEDDLAEMSEDVGGSSISGS